MKRRPTFSEIVVLWKDEKRQYVKQSTYAAYCFLLQNHLLPAFGSMRDITDAAVQQFVNCKLSAGLSQKSVKDMLVVVKMVLSKDSCLPGRSGPFFRWKARGERYRFCRCTTSGF